MNPYQNSNTQRISNNPYMTTPFPQQNKFAPSFQPPMNDFQNPNNFSSPYGIPQGFPNNESISPPSYPQETRYPPAENFQYNRREPERTPNYPYARQPPSYPPNAKPASLSRSMISKPGPFEGDFPPGSPPLQMFSPNNRNMRPNPPSQFRNPRSLDDTAFRPPPQYSPEDFEPPNRRPFEMPPFEKNPYESYERPILREKPFFNHERARPAFENERTNPHFAGERVPPSYMNERAYPPSSFSNERGYGGDRIQPRLLNERGPPPPPNYLNERPAFESMPNEFNPRRSYDILPPPPEYNPGRSFEMFPPPMAHRPLPPPEFPTKIPYHINERYEHPLFEKPILNFDRPLSSSFIPSLYNRPNFDSSSIPRSNYDISPSYINRSNFDNPSSNSMKPTHLKKEYDDLAEILKECVYFDRSVEKCKEELARRPEFKLVDLMRFLDDNHTGALTPNELKEGLKKLGLNPDENDLALVINRYSRDGNNRIEGGELSQMILPISGLNKTSILAREGTGKLSKETAACIVKLFKMLLNTNFSCEELRKEFAKKNYSLLEIFKFIGNQNGENMIQRNDLKSFLEKFFFYPTKEDLDNLCHRFDRNNTGSINFKEFEYELMPKQKR